MTPTTSEPGGRPRRPARLRTTRTADTSRVTHPARARAPRVAAAAAVTGLLAACGGAGPLDDGPRTVTYWLWNADQQPAYQQCADDFAEAHPEYEVRIEQRGWDDYWNALALGFVSESAPDVFANHLAKFPEFVTRDQLLPLDEYVARDDVPLDVYEDGLTDLWLGADGRRYGLPKDWDTVGVFYNREMLAEAGISESEMANLTWNPEDGGSYEDVIARLTVDVNGVRGDEPGFDRDRVRTYGLWLNGSGGDGHGQEQWSMYAASTGWRVTDTNPWGTEFQYDAPEFRATLAWWRGLIDKGYMPSFAAQEGVEPSAQMAAGRAAMATGGSWMTRPYHGYDALDPGIAPTPIGPTGERASIFNGLADSVYAGTDDPEAAWAWARYLGSLDCQRVVAEHKVVFPAITEAWELAQRRYAEDGIDVTPFTQHVEDGTTVLYPITDHAADVTATLIPALEAILSGQAPIDSLERVNRDLNRLFE